MDWKLNKNKFTDGELFGASILASKAVSLIASTAFGA
jgi:hypothetical protein